MIFIGLVLFSKVMAWLHEAWTGVRSLADDSGGMLGALAVVGLWYLWVGDWLLATGRIGPTAHLAGAAISLLMVSVVALAAAVIVIERMGASAQ